MLNQQVSEYREEAVQRLVCAVVAADDHAGRQRRNVELLRRRFGLARKMALFMQSRLAFGFGLVGRVVLLV